MTSINKDEEDDFINAIRLNKGSVDLEDRKDDMPTGLRTYDSNVDGNDSENSDSGSGLSTISDKSDYFGSKVSYQRRALFRKSVSLQMRQIGTNI